jgi:Phage tail tube protein
MPVLQSTNRVKLSKVHETTFSETPVNPVFKAVRETSSSLAANPKTVVSSEIRPDRQVTDLVLVDEDADGDVAGEIAFGVADDDFEEALQGTWANNPAIVVMTSDTEISDVSATTLTVAAGGAVFGNTCRNANLRIHTSTLSLATSMPTTTRSICAIIHSLPCSVRAQRPLQLFGLRKTPVLSLALKQALSLLGAGGLSSSDGRLVGTARSHILADFLDTRAQSGRIVAAREPHHVFVLRLGIRPRRVSGETVEQNQAAVLWPQGAPRLSAHGSMMGLKITSTLMTSALGSVMMGVKAFLGK